MYGHGLTYSAAKAMMDKAPDRGNGRRRRLANNTYLYYDQYRDMYYVRLHATNVVEIHADGTYKLNSGGWDTSLTSGRMRDYAPNWPQSGSYIVKGAGWVITQPDDPKTAPKVQKCRRCHGVGTTTSPAYITTYGRLPIDTYTDEIDTTWPKDPKTGRTDYRADPIRTKVSKLHEAGSYGNLPVPIYNPAITSDCYMCDATGKRDYGSKPNPIMFYDGIRLNSDGTVIPEKGDVPVRVIETQAEIAKRHAEQAKRVKLYAIREKREFMTQNGLRPAHGSVVMYKAVNSDMVSNHGATYDPDTTVVADDWKATDMCGNGLHFSPTPSMALMYHQYGNEDDDARYLACRLKTRGMVILGDKVKTRECRVLHEVDIDGNRLNSDGSVLAYRQIHDS